MGSQRTSGSSRRHLYSVLKQRRFRREGGRGRGRWWREVPSPNARKAKWHQIHRVGALFGIELHSKKAEILPKITQQCDRVAIGWRR
jgi:hypothetical protein